MAPDDVQNSPRAARRRTDPDDRQPALALRAQHAAQLRLAREQLGLPERSLAQFLADDRHKARQNIDRSPLAEARAAVVDHRRILDKPVDELKARYAALRPKLQELRRGGVHVANALSAMASDVADQLVRSLNAHVEEKIRKPLPEAVKKLPSVCRMSGEASRTRAG